MSASPSGMSESMSGNASLLADTNVDALGAPASEAARRARRATFIVWLRKVHGWIGLWGALLGLLFGLSGVVLNHRAVMKFPAAQQREASWQVKLPAEPPVSAQAMADWLRHELSLDAEATRVREEGPRGVPWGDRTLRQPAHWTATFASAQSMLNAEYWVGNDYVALRRSDANFFAVLNNLHKGVGGGVGWILLADTIGAGMIALALTGVLLWTQLNRRRMIGGVIVLASVITTIVFATRALN